MRNAVHIKFNYVGCLDNFKGPTKTQFNNWTDNCHKWVNIIYLFYFQYIYSNFFFYFFSQADFFEVFMCKLMSNTNSKDDSILYPSEEMIQKLYQEVIKVDMYHFHDCAGRASRDCRVFRAAEQFLEVIFKSVSTKVSQRVAA